MEFVVRLLAGSRERDCHLELPPEAVQARSGKADIRLDGETAEVDWAEVAPGVYSFLIGGQSHEAHVSTPEAARPDGRRYVITVGTRHYQVEVTDPRRLAHAAPVGAHAGPQEIVAPMPGKIVKVLVKEHEEVTQGAGLLVIEAMKMQNELHAPRAGRVEKVYVDEAMGVEAGSKLIRLA